MCIHSGGACGAITVLRQGPLSDDGAKRKKGFEPSTSTLKQGVELRVFDRFRLVIAGVTFRGVTVTPKWGGEWPSKL